MLNTISKVALLIGLISLPLQSHAEHEAKTEHIIKASIAPKIDGLNNDTAWDKADWHQIDQVITGALPQNDDFNGRYKVVWTQERLYILAEIVDDILIDRYAHPLDSYWNDDALEILIDENNSGGNHKQSYNAFAYHIALDNQVVDISSSGEPRLLNDHVQSVWKRSANDSKKIVWEMSIAIYPDTFKDQYGEDEAHASPVMLKKGKKMGLMIAYNDNDGGSERENFITSFDIQAVDGDKNRAYIDASVFETVILVDQ